jgi:lipopolysaccharide transport system permease protein
MQVTVIKPKIGIGKLDLKELFQFRELFGVLAFREFQVRYKQTAIGVIWAIVRPFITMVVFTLVFSKALNIDTNGIPYPIFSYSGLLLWTFFSTALSQSAASMIGNSKLITKIYFPRAIIPASATIVSLIDYSIAFVIMLGMMLYYNIAFTSSILFLPLILLITWLLSIGLGFWLSAINVKYRDVQYALPFLIQILMYTTPVIYPVALAGKYSWVLNLNPLSPLIEAHRISLIGGAIDWNLVLMSLGVTIIILISGYLYFKSVEKYFADII